MTGKYDEALNSAQRAISDKPDFARSYQHASKAAVGCNQMYIAVLAVRYGLAHNSGHTGLLDQAQKLKEKHREWWDQLDCSLRQLAWPSKDVDAVMRCRISRNH